MTKAQEGLALLAKELRNAKARESRQSNSAFTYAIKSRHNEIAYHIRKLRKEFRALAVLERAHKQAMNETPRYRAQNRGMTGTYGR